MKFIKKHTYAAIFLALFAFWIVYSISNAIQAGKSYSFVDIAAATVCAAISAPPLWAALSAYRFFWKRKTLPVEGPGISQQALSKRESRRDSKGPASKKVEYDVEGTDQSFEEYTRKNQQAVDAFCKSFDLSTPEGIHSITAEDAAIWRAKAPGIPSNPEQILSKMASKHNADGNLDLAIECLKKANELYASSGLMYDEKTYRRLVRYLYKAGRFEEGDQAAAKISKMFHTDTEKTSLGTKMSKEALSTSLKQARSMDTDLVEVSWIGACCGTCGKYRGRIFSIDGKDKRFPKFPDDFCTECGLMAYAFFDGISRPQYCPSDNYIEYNRRPFFDTRTEEEKQGYQERLRKADHERALIVRERQDRVDYAWIRDNLPVLLPKTFAGYRRMKTQNTKNYQKIQAAALEKGYKL